MANEEKTDNNNHKKKTAGEIATLLARHRTTISFQRTRLAEDRTLMSVIRTSLSLIGFGFTIFQFFRSLKSVAGTDKNPSEVADNIGLFMVGLGISFLFFGIIYHMRFMYELRKERTRLSEQGLIAKHDEFPISLTLMGAVALLIIGLYIIIKMFLIHIKPLEILTQ